jgi:hypothetical protein
VALPSTLKSSKALKAKVAESDAEESSVDDHEDGSDDNVFKPSIVVDSKSLCLGD